MNVTKAAASVCFLSACVLAGSALAQRVNLAKFQVVTVDSVWDNDEGDYVTDGIVGNENRWVSSGSGPHWCIIDFPLQLAFGSAHLFLGKDDAFIVANFSLQYHNGTNWVNIPGATVNGNTLNELNIIFSQTVVSDRIRFHTNDADARVKEIALFPPNDGAGYPIGTDYLINLAQQRLVRVSSSNGSNRRMRAVDGRVADDSRWLSNNVAGPHTFEIDLEHTTKIGSAHLYSGFGATDPIVNFTLQYWNGNTWADISGGTVSNNTGTELRVDFALPVTTSRVRLWMPDTGFQRVKELLIFPANHGVGYPLGTNVEFRNRNPLNFKDFHDDFYTLVNQDEGFSLVSDDDGASLAQYDPEGDYQQYQMLYMVDTDYYRIRNRQSGKTLQVQNASLAPGAAIVEDWFTSLPHQLWKLQLVSGNVYQLVNVWSQLALDLKSDGKSVGRAVVQNKLDASTTQQWELDYVTHYPKKGTGGWVGVQAHGHSWAYNWGLGNSDPGKDINFASMRWGNNGYQGLNRRRSQWFREDKPRFLMGFNEPDESSQSNVSTSAALDAWPRLMQMNVPLVSPATVNPFNGWANTFMNSAANRGYRIEYYGVHTYPGPSADGIMGTVNSASSTFGKPVWLTEWSSVDWSGNGNWDYKDNYNFFAEVLWRLEGSNSAKRYAVFIFSGNPDGKRSNFFSGGNRTPIGQIYSAWDGDRTIRTGRTYYLYNRGFQVHLRNNLESGLLDEADILEDDFSSFLTDASDIDGKSLQWELHPVGNNDHFYIVSIPDKRRLSYDGSIVSLVDKGTEGPDVEWDENQSSNGWFYLTHVATGRRLVNNDGSYATIASNSNMWTWNRTQWRFIRPYFYLEPPDHYVIHKASGKKLRWNEDGDVGLGPISNMGNRVRWLKSRIHVNNDTWFHLDNVRAPKQTERLHASSARSWDVEVLDSVWRDGNLQWQLVDAGNNWFRLGHESSGFWLNSDNGVAVDLVSTTDTDDTTRWRLIQTNEFYLVHKTSGRKLRIQDLSDVSLADFTDESDEVIWQQIHVDGDWFCLDSKAAPYRWARLHAKSSEGFDVNRVSAVWNDVNLHWQLIDAGDGWYRLAQKSSSGQWLHSADGWEVDLIPADVSNDDTLWRMISLEDVIAPAVPTGLTAGLATGRVNLDWSDNLDADLESYRVYRSEDFGATYTLIGSGVTGSEFVDASVVPGNRYTYAVTALDGSLGESALSEQATVLQVDGDLNLDSHVNLLDVAELGTGWPDPLGFDAFAAVASDWLFDPTLIAHWPLDTDATDVSGYGLHGLAHGNPTWTANGRQGGALMMDGVDDYIEIPGFKGILGTRSRTCSAWIKTAQQFDGQILAWGDVSVSGGKILVRITNDGSLRVSVGAGNTWGSTPVNDDQWHHIAVVIEDDGSPDVAEFRLYVDGQLESAGGGTPRPVDTVPGDTFKIGVDEEILSGAPFYQGLIDDVRLYDRALSVQEIEKLAQ